MSQNKIQRQIAWIWIQIASVSSVSSKIKFIVSPIDGFSIWYLALYV